MDEPANPKEQEVQLTTVLVCDNPVQLALAQGILNDAGIPYFLNTRSWGPVSSIRAPYVTAFDLDGQFRIEVASERADEASELVAHLR